MNGPTDDPEFEKGLPASLDGERTILGAILLDNVVFFDGIADLRTDDFAHGAHQRIFACMSEILFGLVEGVRHVDLITLSEVLSKRKQISSVGGVAYLSSLTEGLPRNLVCDEYVAIVREKAKFRRMINICSHTITRCADQGENVAKVMEDLQNDLFTEDAEREESATHIGSIVASVEEDIEKGRAISDERTHLQLSWGVSGLDEFTKGAFTGEMTILAAESGTGKTLGAIQMMLANAQEGTAVGLFSIEMQKEKIVRRFYPQMSEIITADHIRDPRLMNLHTHVPEMRRLSNELAKLPIWIDDTSPMTINKLIARARMMKRKHDIRLFVIDYVQLIVPAASKSEVDGAKNTVYALRDLLKAEPDIHLLLLSQYSKSQNYGKKTKRSRADLYGTQSLHFAAQNVLIMTVESEEGKEHNELLEVEFRIDKQRDGRKGKVNCMFDRDRLKFVYPQPPLR